MKNYQGSKWTSLNRIKGWRHFEVKNVNKKKSELELFAVCDNKITLSVKFHEIKNQNKWLSGWVKLNDMNLVIATHNKDKCKEILFELKNFNVNIKTLDQFPSIGEIEENGLTLKENALIKVREVYKKTGLPCIGDDTGLEVDVLDGAPGVFSARYAGKNCTYLDNINKMLNDLKNIPNQDRKAQFRTVMAYKDSNMELTCEGIVKGYIMKEIKGLGGFGYDPLFYVTKYKKTFAEMNMNEKNKISHRGIAIKSMVQLLIKNGIILNKNIKSRGELA